jgi:tetratricopeptide (TPR) repeat protein
MFQINIYLRFALIAFFLIGGIAPALIKGLSFWWGLPFILVGLVLLAGYFLLGTINSTALLLQAGKIEEAEKRLALTFWPKLLYVANRSYYYMIKGNIALSQKDTDAGEMWLRKAQEIKLPSDNEKAMLELQLANIAASKGKWSQAQLHFRNLKDLKITETTIKDQVKQFEKALENRGQMKAAMRMGNPGAAGMMQPGGKRRRPKMR